MRRLRHAASLVVLLTVIALSTQPAASAARQWSRLAVSTDGEHWATSLDRPLLDNDMVWVPGDSAARTFYVKNRSGEKARLGISLRANDPSDWLDNDAFRLAIQRGANAPWVRITSTERQEQVPMVLTKGQVVQVSVRVMLLPRAGRPSMNRSLAFNVQVRLSEFTSTGG